MKSIFDYVACCRSDPRTSKPPEETRWLVLTQTQVPPRRKRRSTAGLEWRPSLSAIHEDSSSTAEKANAAASERMLRDRAHEHRNYERPVVIPAFGPTFWF